MPLDEELWDKQPYKPDYYFLLGIPNQLIKFDEDYINLYSTLHAIEPLEKKPPCFAAVSAPTFFGKIKLNNKMTSIKGMSGGPLFSLKKTSDNQLLYWLHGVQSRWVESEQYIAACLMTPFVRYIRQELIKYHKE